MTFLLIIIALLICVVLGFVLLVLHSLPKRQPFQPRGKHTLVTGGSKGIGRCIAAELLTAGCRVVSIVARDQAALEKAKEELEAKYCDQSEGGQRVRIYSMDVAESSTEKIQELITEMEADSGPVDLLVNNAGFCFQGAFDELPADAFERQMRVNFFSAVNFTRAVLPSMKRKGAGHIAFVSSAAGQCAIWGYSAYSPSKFALRALADVLHAELRPHGIGVSVLFPPNTATEGFQEEQRTMPEQVRLISNSAGVFSPEQVASAFVGSLRTGQFWTCLGMEGKMLGLLAAAASPEPNPLKALAQLCLAGLVRGVMLIYGGQFYAVIQKCHDQQEQQQKKISEKEAAEGKSE